MFSRSEHRKIHKNNGVCPKQVLNPIPVLVTGFTSTKTLCWDTQTRITELSQKKIKKSENEKIIKSAYFYPEKVFFASVSCIYGSVTQYQLCTRNVQHWQTGRKHFLYIL